MSGDFSDWYKSIPQITRYWFTGSVIVPLAVRFSILNARNLVFVFSEFIYKFQVIKI
jgi:derlin-1